PEMYTLSLTRRSSDLDQSDLQRVDRPARCRPRIAQGYRPGARDVPAGDAAAAALEAEAAPLAPGVVPADLRPLRRGHQRLERPEDRKSTRLNSSHVKI